MKIAGALFLIFLSLLSYIFCILAFPHFDYFVFLQHFAQDRFYGCNRNIRQNIAYFLFGNRENAIQDGSFYSRCLVYLLAIDGCKAFIKIIIASKKETIVYVTDTPQKEELGMAPKGRVRGTEWYRRTASVSLRSLRSKANDVLQNIENKPREISMESSSIKVLFAINSERHNINNHK